MTEVHPDDATDVRENVNLYIQPNPQHKQITGNRQPRRGKVLGITRDLMIWEWATLACRDDLPKRRGNGYLATW
jgi:hypothetical protein